MPSLPDSSGQSAGLANHSPKMQPLCANALTMFVVAVATPSTAVRTSATEPLPLLTPFTAVWSVVSADFSALI